MNNFSKDELILVTGASSGIGESTIYKLNALGLNCIGLARSEDKLKKVKNNCKYPEKFNYVIRDLSQDLDCLSDFISDIVKTYGKFSGFVHCAGVLNLMPISAWDYTSAIKDFNINLFSAIEMIKGLSKKKNKQELLNIVLVSSMAAQKSYPAAICYGMTKASLNNLAIGLTREIGSKKIRINTIMPGGCNTDMAVKHSEDSGNSYITDVLNKTPFKEIGKPEYVANLISFLLSKDSYWIQGQCIPIDGGEYLN